MRMRCAYTFKGHYFANELLLTDFLIERYPLMKEFGDLVFSLSPEAIEIKRKIEGKITDDGRAQQMALGSWVKTGSSIVYDDDGKPILNYKRPVIGVNKYLDKFRYLDDSGTEHQIIADFRDNEFWNRRLALWKNGHFSDEELQLIETYEGAPINTSTGVSYPDAQLQEWKKLVQDKWTAQGRVGSALHKVSQVVFGEKVKNGLSEVPLWKAISDDPSFAETYWDTIKNKPIDEYNPDKVEQYITKDQYLEMVTMVDKFRAQLQNEYGENCLFYPELAITARTSEEVLGCNQLLGIIDLLVVDEKGIIHIYDYKTSPKPYEKYNENKKSAFTFQVGTYERMLKQYGIYTENGSYDIVPIQLQNFRLEGDKSSYHFTYDTISYENAQHEVAIKQLSQEIHSSKVVNALEKFMPSSTSVTGTANDLLTKVSGAIRKLFPNYMQQRGLTKEEIVAMIEKENQFKPNEANQLWYPGYEELLTVDANRPNAKEELVAKVQKDLDSVQQKKINLAEGFIKAFNESVKTKMPFEWKTFGFQGFDSQYLQNTLAPYCDGSYKINDSVPALKNFGIVLLENIRTKVITPIKLTGADLFQERTIAKGRHNLNANFASDVEESSNPNSLMIKSLRGNIEAMEAMLALQFVDWSTDVVNIDEIKVFNPNQQHALPISNKELQYNFNLLIKQASKNGNILEGENKFETGRIKLLSSLNVMSNLIDDIKASVSNPYYNKARTVINDGFDWNAPLNTEEAITKLTSMMRQLEKLYSQTLTGISKNSHDLNLPEVRLYNKIAQALLELKNVNVRQQVKDADNWLESFKGIFTQGAEGLNLENPGNFRSDALNQITKSIKNVHQKVRDVVLRRSYKNQEMVEKLKRAQGFSSMDEKFKNQTSLYDGMTYVDADGDFMFVNPNTLTGARKEFLEYVLTEINKDRFPDDEANFEDWKNSGKKEYYRVPLLAASRGSKMHTSNLLQDLKDRCKNWTPSTALESTQKFVDDALNASDKAEQHENVYVIGNMFKASNEDPETRKRMLQRGVAEYEHNLETILLHHQYAYTRAREMSKEMPMIKAATLAIAMQGNTANPNQSENFANMIKFVENYITTRVNQKSTYDSKLAKPAKALGKVRGLTSLLALGFSPVQWTRQRLEGIWKGIALIIKKPDGTHAFTAKHMWEAWKELEKEVFMPDGKPTVNSRINELYGINDMDSTQYANRLSSDRGWTTHLYDLAFRFTSRPDYYNRMMIFKAKMKQDGCEKAHKLDKNGRLVYDWTLDERFAAYAKVYKTKSFENFTVAEREAYSNYIATAKEMISEGAYNEDGSLFKLGDALPRAYSNREASAIKSIGDNIYGYYNDEDKSMINNMFLGGLAMQMKTYWSAKKNQYFAPGGVKMQGHWVDYQENGVYMTYAKTAEGAFDITRMVPEGDPESSGIRVQRWEGQWQEGVIVTMANFYKSARENGWKNAWHESWDNPDQNMQVMFRSNMKHLCIDMFVMCVLGPLLAALLGGWDDEEKKAWLSDKEDMSQALSYAGEHLFMKTINNSLMDFNWIKSIGDPLTQWNPFAFQSLGGLLEDGWNVIKGEETVINLVGDNISAVRTVKPMLITATYDKEKEQAKRAEREQKRLEKQNQ